jgi:hypothetical protein
MKVLLKKAPYVVQKLGVSLGLRLSPRTGLTIGDLVDVYVNHGNLAVVPVGEEKKLRGTWVRIGEAQRIFNLNGSTLILKAGSAANPGDRFRQYKDGNVIYLDRVEGVENVDRE